MYSQPYIEAYWRGHDASLNLDSIKDEVDSVLETTCVSQRLDLCNTTSSETFNVTLVGQIHNSNIL